MSLSLSPRTSRSQPNDSENDFGDERVVLRTTDEAFFRVKKHTLADCSNIFRALFSTEEPQHLATSISLEERPAAPDNSGVLSFSGEHAADGLPFIRVSADGKTLDALLQIIYAISANGSQDRKIRDVDGTKDVLLIAHKYGFNSIVAALCEQLLSDLPLPFSENSGDEALTNLYALRVYALACRLRRAPLAEAAAYEVLRGRVSPAAGRGEAITFPELQELPAIDYFHLQDYHARAGEAVAKLFETEEDGDDCGMPVPYAELTRCSDCSEDPENGKDKAAWWRNYVSRAAQVVRDVPRSQEIFSSDFLKEAYEIAEACKGDCRTQIDARWLALSLILKERIDNILGKIDLAFGVEETPQEDQGRMSKLYRKVIANE